MMLFAIPPSVVRFSISNHLTQYLLDWLEHDLQQLVPGTRLVAVHEDHCDWEGAFRDGETWNTRQVWFLERYGAHVQVILHPPDPRLDTDVYNVGLLFHPTLPLALPLGDFEYERRHVGEVFHGPFHGLGFWWKVIKRDQKDNVLLCLPAPPPVGVPWDYVPRFLYCCHSHLHYEKGKMVYWCPTCWKETYSLEGVTKITLADLLEPRVCTMCGRDFCADDARAPECASYYHRDSWRRPIPQ